MGLMQNITCFAFRLQFNLICLSDLQTNSFSFSVANPQTIGAQSL